MMHASPEIATLHRIIDLVIAHIDKDVRLGVLVKGTTQFTSSEEHVIDEHTVNRVVDAVLVQMHCDINGTGTQTGLTMHDIIKASSHDLGLSVPQANPPENLVHNMLGFFSPLAPLVDLLPKYNMNTPHKALNEHGRVQSSQPHVQRFNLPNSGTPPQGRKPTPKNSPPSKPIVAQTRAQHDAAVKEIGRQQQAAANIIFDKRKKNEANIVAAQRAKFAEVKAIDSSRHYRAPSTNQHMYLSESDEFVRET